ncbi:MAG TPA: DUF4279 domain-containing protein [Coleofasciculaceae cyanobacterium]|jgi:hypothetical protein
MAQEPEYLSSATLIILADDLDPQEVTEQLGLQPNRSWCKGEQKSFVRNNGTVRKFNDVYEWGGWKCFLPEEKKHLNLAEQLSHWCDALEGRESAMRELERQGYSLEINCYISTAATASIILSADLQKRLADLRLDLFFDIFKK